MRHVPIRVSMASVTVGIPSLVNVAGNWTNPDVWVSNTPLAHVLWRIKHVEALECSGRAKTGGCGWTTARTPRRTRR